MVYPVRTGGRLRGARIRFGIQDNGWYAFDFDGDRIRPASTLAALSLPPHPALLLILGTGIPRKLRRSQALDGGWDVVCAASVGLDPQGGVRVHVGARLMPFNPEWSESLRLAGRVYFEDPPWMLFPLPPDLLRS